MKIKNPIKCDGSQGGLLHSRPRNATTARVVDFSPQRARHGTVFLIGGATPPINIFGSQLIFLLSGQQEGAKN